MERGTLHVIGVDLENCGQIPASILEKCAAVVVSNRFQQRVKEIDSAPAHYEILPIAPLVEAVQHIDRKLEDGDVAVLASGDPLFFGIGRRLLADFAQDRIRIYPAASAMQHAFARFAIPWDDATFVSLHGRSPENYVGLLLAHHKTAVLTDGSHRPETISADLLDFLGDNADQFTVHVAENLGMADERLTSGTLAQIAVLTCGSLCCMLLIRNPSQATLELPAFGLTEKEIVHSRGLITKNEIRAAALHALAVPANAIMWDIGAGSGSVGLEAARMHRDLLVYAVEKEVEQQENIIVNARRYEVVNLKLIRGYAPQSLVGLPRPHRIFIGGNGGNLAEILPVCARELLPGGKIVVTAVLAKTCAEAPELLHRAGLQVESCRLEVQRTTHPAGQTTVLNPISIIIGSQR